MATKIIDNFGGRLVRDTIGDMNSGLAKYATTFGNDPFSNPGNLSWQETATQIDPGGAVITDMIVAGKERIESGISYVYAVGHTARVYKIQVNDPASHNANYDNPVLLVALGHASTTFTNGGSIEFFGATEKIYIGHDAGFTTIAFDGSGEAYFGLPNASVAPRPMKQFLGKLYIGNVTNISEVDSTGTVTAPNKLSPAFPDNCQVRDIDVSPDGNYLEIVVCRTLLPDITSPTADTTSLSNSESYIFKWNGTDIGYTAYDSFPSFSLNSNIMFGQHQYTFGYDIAGGAVFNPTQKILSTILAQAPLPNAVGSNGNLVGWAVPEFFNGFLRMSNFVYGSLDQEIGVGWWRQFAQSATATETDVIRVPFQLLVSNLVIGATSNGYPGGVIGFGKAYFSTLETSDAPTTKYKLYKWFPVPTTVGTPVQGIYETQQETTFRLFRSVISSKFQVKNVRIYTSPLVTGNSFQIDLIGSDGNPMDGATKIFTVGSNDIVAGQDFCWYTPAPAPTYSVGVRITNLGSVNWVGNKIELDYEEGGK